MTDRRADRPAARTWSGAVRLTEAIPGWLRAWAGPLLIVIAVLIPLHGFWLGPKLTNQQVDLLAFWLPRWCHLGDALASGHIPTWLPNQFGGVPMASDPQSGWLYLPPMLLFSVASCARALGLMVVLQPILGGTGLYLFLRNDGVGRPAATVGGLTMALTATGSVVALSLPFSGMLAWTAMCLAGAAGALRARTPLRTLGWGALAALSWSQIAGAHLTHGLLMGTMVVSLYVLARSIALVRAREASFRAASLRAGALLASFPLLGAAVLIPRLALLPRTSIGHGYAELAALATELSGTPNAPPFAARGVGVWWATSFARAPVGYVGVLALLLIPAALAGRRWRWPAAAFTLAGLAGYLLNSDRLITSGFLRRLALDIGFSELWLRSPYRFRHLLIVAFGALAGYGLQAWIDGRRPARMADTLLLGAWFVPGVIVFGILPAMHGATADQSLAFALGLAWAPPALLLIRRGMAWLPPILAVAVGIELVIASLAAQASPIGAAALERAQVAQGLGLSFSFERFRPPDIPPGTYMEPGPIGLALQRAEGDGRYLAFVPEFSRSRVRGFLSHQQADEWGTYENGRSILMGIDEIQGYSPVQLDRYWRLVRRVNPKPIYYNSASFQTLEPGVLRLFGVEWLIVRATVEPPPGSTLMAAEGQWMLYRLPEVDPRASLVFSWDRVSEDQALEGVIDPAFRPTERAFIEAGGPPSPGSAATGTAQYEEARPGRAIVRTQSDGAGLLVVRNAYDRNWKATIDGAAAEVHQVDYMMQGVFVPTGSHVVELTYRDRAIGLGLLAGAIGWGLVGGWALVVWIRGRRRRVPATAAGSTPDLGPPPATAGPGPPTGSEPRWPDGGGTPR